MYHILLITDNRLLMKGLYDMIADQALFKIHVLSFSVDASEVFYKHQIDLVILDDQVYMSSDCLLDMFRGCSWNYEVILLTNDLDHVSEDQHVVALESKYLTKDILEKALNQAIEAKSTADIGQHRTTYALFLLALTEAEQVSEAVLQVICNRCRPSGNLQVVSTDDHYALFSMSRQDMALGYSVTKIAGDLLIALGGKAAVIYDTNVGAEVLEAGCETIWSMAYLTEYLEGSYTSIDDIERHKSQVPIGYGKENIRFLIHAIMDGQEPMIRQVIQELYNHVIKEHYDGRMRDYVQMHMQILSKILTPGDVLIQASNLTYQSVDQEMAQVLKWAIQAMGVVADHGDSHQLVKDIMLAIVDSYEAGISLEGVANVVGYNKNYINRLMKDSFGMTVFEVIQIYRIQTAKWLLMSSDLKVSDISKQLGYQDSGYFGKSFKKVAGMTPNHFRSRYLEQWLRRDHHESIMAI